MAEGGSFAWLNEKTAAIGRSICVNEEGSRQIEEVLNAQGVELLRVDMTGYSIHIDGALTMIDVDVAIVDPTAFPILFCRSSRRSESALSRCRSRTTTGSSTVWRFAPAGSSCLGGISNRTADTLAAMDIEIIEIDYDKVQLNGGGIHCSTCPLVRDSVY